MTETRRARVRAPELAGRAWLGTGGADLSLAALRGKVVLLDFWTSCCVNCLHVLEELRDLERDFADVLVVVGVHSPKFAHEADPAAVADAVERYRVEHPVLDDPELTHLAAPTPPGPGRRSSWSTPSGYVVAQLSGEGHAHGLRVLLDGLVAEHEASRHAAPRRRTVRPACRRRAPPCAIPVPALALPGGTYLVADSAHHQLVELDADLADRAAQGRLRPPRPARRPGRGGRVRRAAGPRAAARRTSRPGSATTSSSPTAQPRAARAPAGRRPRSRTVAGTGRQLRRAGRAAAPP